MIVSNLPYMRSTDSLPREALMDDHHALHLPRVLSDPHLRCPECQVFGPILLDACYSSQ